MSGGGRISPDFECSQIEDLFDVGLSMDRILFGSDPTYPIQINFIRSDYPYTIQFRYPIINGLDINYPYNPFINQTNPSPTHNL